MITPVMLATGLISALLYLQTSQQAATGHAYARQLEADLVASAPGGLSPTAAARPRGCPASVAVSPLVTSDGSSTCRAAPIRGRRGHPAGGPGRGRGQPGHRLPGHGRDACPRLRGDTIAIPAADRAARPRGGRDGVTLRFGDNAMRRLTRRRRLHRPRGYPLLLLPAGLLAAHTTTGLAGQVLVRTDGRADRAALQQALRAVAPGARVTGRAATLAAFSAAQQTGAWVTYLLVAARAGLHDRRAGQRDRGRRGRAPRVRCGCCGWRAPAAARWPGR